LDCRLSKKSSARQNFYRQSFKERLRSDVILNKAINELMSQSDRIYLYKALFKNKRLLSKEDILGKLEISLATFKRDLDKMRDVYNYEIVYDRFENGYRLNDTNEAVELPGLMFTQGEILALMTIQSMIEQLEPGLLGPKLKPLQERLDGLLEAQGMDATTLAQRVRLLHAGKRRMHLKSFEALAKATLERKQIKITHYNRQSGERVERTISPQQLVHYRENWYVDAWCHLRNGLRSFSVDAIEECTVLEKDAKELNPDAIKSALSKGYGIFGGSASEWAKVRFTPERTRWVQFEEWHPDQRGTLEKDGAYLLELPYSDERELIGDLLRMGPDVQVLSPPSLVKKFKTTVKDIASLYE